MSFFIKSSPGGTRGRFSEKRLCFRGAWYYRLLELVLVFESAAAFLTGRGGAALVGQVHQLRLYAVKRIKFFLEPRGSIRVAAELKDEQSGWGACPRNGLIVQAEPCKYRAPVLRQNSLHLNGALAAVKYPYRHYLITVHICTSTNYFLCVACNLITLNNSIMSAAISQTPFAKGEPKSQSE